MKKYIITLTFILINTIDSKSQSFYEIQNPGAEYIVEAKNYVEDFNFNAAEKSLKGMKKFYGQDSGLKADFNFVKFFIELNKNNFDQAEEFHDHFKNSYNKDKYNNLIKQYSNLFYDDAIDLYKSEKYSLASKKFYKAHLIKKNFVSPFSPKALFNAANSAELAKQYEDAIKYYNLILYNGYTRKYDYVAYKLIEGENPELKTYRNQYTRDKAVKEMDLKNPKNILTEKFVKYFTRVVVCHYFKKDISTALDLVNKELKESPDNTKLISLKRQLENEN